jgi:hypothetical protein
MSSELNSGAEASEDMILRRRGIRLGREELWERQLRDTMEGGVCDVSAGWLIDKTAVRESLSSVGVGRGTRSGRRTMFYESNVNTKMMQIYKDRFLRCG